jgi:hypothetical protein
MAVWTAPTTRSTGALVSASIWNTDIVENLKYLKDSPVFDGSPTVNGRLKAATTMSVGNATPSTSGAGITFPATQSASSDANTLDDYEEGTWTPADASGAGLTFTQASGTYTKIGRMVIAHGVVEYPVTANGSNTLISGPSFTPVNAAQNRGGIVTWANLASIAYVLAGAGSTDFRIYANDGSILVNSTVSGKTVIFQFIYYV